MAREKIDKATRKLLKSRLLESSSYDDPLPVPKKLTGKRKRALRAEIKAANRRLNYNEPEDAVILPGPQTIRAVVTKDELAAIQERSRRSREHKFESWLAEGALVVTTNGEIGLVLQEPSDHTPYVSVLINGAVVNARKKRLRPFDNDSD